jgi:hypothetical protein
MVFLGFIAAWFLADSPIKRSLSVKETKDGLVEMSVFGFAHFRKGNFTYVVKEPCSLAMISTFVPS